MTAFWVEPRLVQRANRCVGEYPTGDVQIGAVGRVERWHDGHGQDLEGRRIQRHHGTSLGIRPQQRVHTCPMGHELDLAIDRDYEIGPGDGGLYLVATVRDHLATGRPLGQDTAGSAGEQAVVLRFQSLDPFRVDVDEAHRMGGQGTGGVHTLGLLQEVDTGKFQPLHLAGLLRLDLAGQEHEGTAGGELLP